MSDYYKNLTEKDLNNVLNLNELFSSWNSYYNLFSSDLYFIGIKKGSILLNLPKYDIPIQKIINLIQLNIYQTIQILK